MDIQDSPHFFQPESGGFGPAGGPVSPAAGPHRRHIDAARYIHDDSIDTTDKSVVVDWYYKKPGPGGKELVHYCKFCNGVVLYASGTTPGWPSGVSMTTANTPSSLTCCSRKRTAPPASA